jgi:hypothetical protein
MEAKARSFTFIANEGLLKIPFFQRGYVWKRDNWEELLIDLSNRGKNHFLGSLILKQQKTSSGEQKEALVIDGQQRLTTLSLLIKSLYDSFSENLQEVTLNSIRQNLFYKVNATDSTFLIKIQHSHIDSEMFENVINNGIEYKYIDFVAGNPSRILDCYLYFREELKSYTENDRTSLFNYLMNPENKIIVVIDLDESDNEQAIFDTINSAGVRLSPADIIKNALFQKAIELGNRINAITLYEKTWKKVFLTDEETISFWEKQRLTGRLLRDNIEILLHAIGVIKGFYDPDKHTLSDLGAIYKEEIDKYSNINELELFIQDIKEYASIFRNKILSFESSTQFSFTNYEQRLFHILDVFEISTFHPLILYIYKQYENDEVSIKNILATLETFIVKRVISKQEIKSFNKLCKDFINDHKAIVVKTNDISITDFYNGLKSISNKSASILLFWIELYRRYNDKKFSIRDLKYDYTLEHIMPQKWEEYWTTFPRLLDYNNNPLPADQLRLNRTEKIYYIGNMTLLTSSLNTSLRNYEFIRKMNGEGKKRGIKVYADLSITLVDIVEKFDKGDIIWDELKIQDRTSTLTDEICKIWNVV